MTKKKQDKKIDPNSLDDIPGIGDVSIRALNREGYFTKKQLVALCNPQELKNIVPSLDLSAAAQAFEFMWQTLEEAGLVPRRVMTAGELLKHRLTIKHMRTGCAAIDNLLAGGFEYGVATEIYGENGAGKTQLAHQLCIMSQLQEENKSVLYLDTENTFRPERLLGILDARNLVSSEADTEKFLSKILVWRVEDALDQIKKIHNIAIEIEKNNQLAIVIVDSAIAQFRSDYLERGTLKTKFNILNEMLVKLKGLAYIYNIPIVAMNQIYNKPDQTFGKDPVIAYGGNIMGHLIPYRLKMESIGSGKRHRLKIIKSPYQHDNECQFQISVRGIEDIEKKELTV